MASRPSPVAPTPDRIILVRGFEIVGDTDVGRSGGGASASSGDHLRAAPKESDISTSQR